MTSQSTIGFIGLGSQGGPMAARIAATYPLYLWARRPEALAPFLELGANAASDLEDLARRCEHIALCVVDDAGVMALADQLLPHMRPGSRLVVHSTISPRNCAILAEQCLARNIGFLDAPVSGGGPAAEQGKLTVMCGGEAADVAAATPIFQGFSNNILHVGKAGAGQKAKIINNALMAANIGLAHHAIALGHQLDLDRAALRDLIKISSGRSFAFDVYARLAKAEDFAHGARLLSKDLHLLNALAPDEQANHALQQSAAAFLSDAGAAPPVPSLHYKDMLP